MRTIRITEDVWQAIASHGKFGENEDDVLRRILELPPNSTSDGILILTKGGRSSYQTPLGKRRTFAKRRMTSYIGSNQLYIEFNGGASSSWSLPDRSDKAGIRSALEKAIQFGKSNGATLGQINAIRKTLTDEGYHLRK
jgi:hypothetical protein